MGGREDKTHMASLGTCLYFNIYGVHDLIYSLSSIRRVVRPAPSFLLLLVAPLYSLFSTLLWRMCLALAGVSVSTPNCSSTALASLLSVNTRSLASLRDT